MCFYAVMIHEGFFNKIQEIVNGIDGRRLFKILLFSLRWNITSNFCFMDRQSTEI